VETVAIAFSGSAIPVLHDLRPREGDYGPAQWDVSLGNWLPASPIRSQMA
jgi:hypothetical protein